MKKVFMMAAAAVMVFASCAENDGPVVETGKKELIVKIAGVKPAGGTRAVEAPGAIGQLRLNNGHIFVINSLNEVDQTLSVALNTATATPPDAPGGVYEMTQTIAGVPSDARIYILGNIPTADVNVATLTNLAEIKAAESVIANNTNYKAAALANSDGLEKSLTNITETTADVVVELSPLYSRIELAQVVGGQHIKSFKVAGVYVDEYYPTFTMAGAAVGFGVNEDEPFMQNQDNQTFTGIGNTEGWDSNVSTDPSADPATDPAIAAPTSPNIWAYHVASKGLPRFIIKLSEVVYMENGSEKTLSETRFITVKSYTESITDFERGKIYRVGGDNGILFNLEDLSVIPNPDDVTLTVKVDVVDWTIEVITPEI